MHVYEVRSRKDNGARQLAGSFCHPAIKNDSGTILSRLHSSVCALADEIQDSYQRRD
jgi:hypothetical protein